MAAGKPIHYVGPDAGINKVFGFHLLWKNFLCIQDAVNHER